LAQTSWLTVVTLMLTGALPVVLELTVDVG
jgi:hypothetical protein